MFPKVITRLGVSTTKMLAARNMGSSAVLLNKADPVQQLYLEKVREYFKKKSASKSGLVDSSPEAQKALKDELEKIAKTYGASASADFPAFNFTDPKIEISADKVEIPKL